MQEVRHIPVLLKEVLEIFSHTHLTHFIDGTLGAGGHALSLLQAHPEIKEYYGVDQDPVAWELAVQTLKEYQDKLTLIKGNVAEVILPKKVDGIMVDLGASSMQFDSKERGFSFRYEAPLDMRMDPSCSLTAEEVINHYSEKDLGQIFREYGEIPKWKKVAHTIVTERKKKRIHTTTQLSQVLSSVLHRNRRLHPMTLVYQALRICVNNELQILDSFLPKAIDLLNPKGILSVISFHSLEDRIVKQFFQELRRNPNFEIITKKPIVPTEEEKKRNPRARSAKLRVIQRK